MTTQDELLAASANNYATLFRDRVRATPNAIAYLVPSRNEAGPTTWAPMTWAETRVQVDDLAAGLLSLGLQVEQRVAIAASTRIEWVLADLAIASAAGATTTVYPSSQQEDVEFILADSQAVVLIAENWVQARKANAADGQFVGQLRHVVLIEDDRPDQFSADDRFLTLAALAERGREQLASSPGCVDEAIAGLTPESLSTLIYTSGTTGRPKGVELVHRCWTYEAAAIMSWDFVNSSDLLYLWLPLAHVFGRDLLSIGIAVGFTSAVDGRVDRIVQGLGETHPTILVGVPRIFEKVRSAVITMNPQGGIKARISRWAFAVGRDSRDYRLRGVDLPASLALRYRIADKLVFSKLSARLGGRMRFMISGSAKLSGQVQEWFYSAGLTLIEGYGLTETAAVAALNLPDRPKFGSIGRPLPGIDVKIADDGELAVRGPIVARGYAGLPEETAAAFRDGWFYTGDIAEFDAEGDLFITDRKKDLIKTSNGKYVAPQKVEGTVMANVPYLSQAVAVGEGRNFVVALVTLDREGLLKWGRNHDRPDDDYATLTQLPEIRRSIDRLMRKANTHLAQWETVKKYAILDRELSLDEDELTPSLKVRRGVVLQHFDDVIQDLYDSPKYPFLDSAPGRSGK